MSSHEDQVGSFAIASLRKVLPSSFFQDKQTWGAICAAVRRLVKLNRYESLTLNTVMMGMRPRVVTTLLDAVQTQVGAVKGRMPLRKSFNSTGEQRTGSLGKQNVAKNPGTSFHDSLQDAVVGTVKP